MTVTHGKHGKESNAAGELSRVVEEEARRVLSEATLRADPKLVAEGWERRFIADGRRAEEAVALYQQLGYEVRAEPLRQDELEDNCEDCQLVALMQFKTIYTRRKESATEE
jgi:hypothetical protein